MVPYAASLPGGSFEQDVNGHSGGENGFGRTTATSVIIVKSIIALSTFFTVWLMGAEIVGTSDVWAFRFVSPINGAVVEAGSHMAIRLDPGEAAPLFGVLFMASGGVLEAKLDSMPPYEWSIQIPKTYFGNLTLWAVGRRFKPIPNPPRAVVRIRVIHPVHHAARSDLSPPPTVPARSP
ncbi:MAG: hypothetical protein ACE5J1_02500 [Nitrospiria bacterium]